MFASVTALGLVSVRPASAADPFPRKTVIVGEPVANSCSVVCLGGENAA